MDAGDGNGSGREGAYHVPVMLREVLEVLDIHADGVYVDCTLGGGGHARAILARLGPEGRLVAFDQDADAAANLPEDARVLFVPQNFRHIGRFLRLHRVGRVDGILADLGVSSHQLDTAERGFTTRRDGPLDMRMDRRQQNTAAELLAEMSEQMLQDVLSRYGEVTNARTLARALVEARQAAPIRTLARLREAVAPVVKGNPGRYLAQVYQALRIAVNDEFGALEELLGQVPALLKPGGRIAVITFHSLEDRIVKRFFREGGEGGEADPVFGGRRENPLEAVTRKPVVPGGEELARNPRARSAKLRAARLRTETEEGKDRKR